MSMTNRTIIGVVVASLTGVFCASSIQAKAQVLGEAMREGPAPYGYGYNPYGGYRYGYNSYSSYNPYSYGYNPYSYGYNPYSSYNNSYSRGRSSPTNVPIYNGSSGSGGYTSGSIGDMNVPIYNSPK